MLFDLFIHKFEKNKQIASINLKQDKLPKKTLIHW